MTYELTADDIKNGVTLIKDDTDDDGTITKPFGTFRGGECLAVTVSPENFSIPSSAFMHGDEVRELRLFKTADTGQYLERSVWVSGYTAEEYLSLAEKLNEQADGWLIAAFGGVVCAYTDAERANDFYVLRDETGKKAIDRYNKEARIDELKGVLSKNYDYKQFKWLRGEISAEEWEELKDEIDTIVAEINRLEAEIAEA